MGPSPRLAHRLPLFMLAGILAVSASIAQGGPRWLLIYRRQIGNFENANKGTLENHLFRENGTKGAYVGVTNASNAGFAIFGNTDGDGWNRINPLDPNNCVYDIRIYDPGVPTDQSPNFHWYNPNGGDVTSYSFITQWLYVSDDTDITTFPATAVYDYDLMNGELNSVVNQGSNCVASVWNEPDGADTDYKGFGSARQWHAQTFVVPEGINRIISAQVFSIRAAGTGPFRIRCSIHEGGPNGPQVGPTVISRPKHSVEFKEMAVNWALNAVPVVPGATYALRVVADDGQDFNVYVTSTDQGPYIPDKYPDGALYTEGLGEIVNTDMFATVVGVGVDDSTPRIALSTDKITQQTTLGQNASPSSFTVRNSGYATLNYTISDSASWLSVAPVNGSATTETDTIAVNYDAASLQPDTYHATITVSDPNAAETSASISVTLTVNPPPTAPADMDYDFDVDQEDFGLFQACYTENGIAQNDPACRRARIDDDEDVDQADFALFEACMSGANVVADLDCAG